MPWSFSRGFTGVRVGRQLYLIEDDDGLTLIDAGVSAKGSPLPGSHGA